MYPGLGLYIHIPFCKVKCSYCDFYSVTNNENHSCYISALEKQAAFLGKTNEISTVFIGGGNPGCLTLSSLEKVFNLIHSYDLSGIKEFSMEINPESVTKEKIELCRDYGVTRISMGVQSFNERTLKTLGRNTGKKAILNALEIVKGFNNIDLNLDLIFNVPGQSLNDFKKDVDRVVKINPDSISCYSLILSRGTELTNKVEAGEISLPDENLFVEMYYYLHQAMKQNSYNFYEISNFAKKGKTCLHNENYWQLGEYIGIGASASGYLNGYRYTNFSDIDKYIELTTQNIEPYEKEKITPENQLIEYLMLGLRTTNGITTDKLRDLNSLCEQNRFHNILNEINKLVDNDYLTKSGKNICCTIMGMTVLDEILLRLV